MVTMVRAATLLPMLAPLAPTCPDFVAVPAIRYAAVPFCERARPWRHVTTIALTAAEGDIVAPDTAAIVEIEFAEFNGERLAPAGYIDASEGIVGRPTTIFQRVPDTVIVSPFEPGTLRVSMFLKPRIGSEYGTDEDDPLFDRFDVLPDFLVYNHSKLLVDGALARILAMPGESWSDPGRAAAFRADYERAIDASFAISIRGQQRAPLRTKTIWF